MRGNEIERETREKKLRVLFVVVVVGVASSSIRKERKHFKRKNEEVRRRLSRVEISYLKFPTKGLHRIDDDELYSLSLSLSLSLSFSLSRITMLFSLSQCLIHTSLSFSCIPTHTPRYYGKKFHIGTQTKSLSFSLYK